MSDDGSASPGLFLTRIITKIRDEKDTKKSSNAKLKAACNKALGKTSVHMNIFISNISFIRYIVHYWQIPRKAHPPPRIYGYNPETLPTCIWLVQFGSWCSFGAVATTLLHIYHPVDENWKDLSSLPACASPVGRGERKSTSFLVPSRICLRLRSSDVVESNRRLQQSTAAPVLQHQCGYSSSRASPTHYIPTSNFSKNCSVGTFERADVHLQHVS